MAGGEASPSPRRRRTAKSVEDVATGMQAHLRRCSSSAKRKAAEKEAASGWMPRPCASGAAAAASASASGVCANADKAAGVKNKNRLPAKDIRWILDQVPQAPPRRFAALKRRNPELVPRPGEEEDKNLVALYGVTRKFYEMQERFPKLQAWVRNELKEKGCVEVDDDWFKCKAKAQAAIDREWPRLKAKLDVLRLMDEPCDESESDSEEEEEDEEVALESLMKDYL